MTHHLRTKTGSISEMAAALVILIGFVIVPLVSLSSVPGRYLMCQGVLNDLTCRLSHCEKPSDANSLMRQGNWKKTLATAGINVSGEKLNIIAISADGTKQRAFAPGQKWDKDWLPNGANAPCIYTMSVSCRCAMNIPGAPITVSMVSNSQWENTARNVKSQSLSYFIEE